MTDSLAQRIDWQNQQLARYLVEGEAAGPWPLPPTTE